MTEQPGQEQRAFWAILLAMGVLLAWSMLFPVGTPPAPQPGEIVSGTAEPAGQDIATLREPADAGEREGDATGGAAPDGGTPERAGAGSAGTGGSLLGVLDGGGGTLLHRDADEAVRETVRITGQDLDLTIDGRGARITQAELKDYTVLDGETVKLLPEKSAGALGSVVVVGERELPLDQFVFRLVSDASTPEGRQVVWELALEELVLRKTYVVPAEGYRFRVEHELLSDRVGLDGWGLAWAGGLDVTEHQLAQNRGPYFQGSVMAEGKVQKKSQKDFKNGPVEFPGNTYFVAVHNKYFVGAIVPEGENQGPARLWAAGGSRDREPGVAAEILVERTAGLAADRVGYDIFVGPMDYDLMKSTGLGIQKTIDLGWSWIRPLSKQMLGLLIWMHSKIPNYGVVIILFSLMVNLLFYPLTYKSTKSMRDMAALKPRLDALKEKYKDEPQKMSEATMKLYKEAGVNPLAGCLPLFLQMPVFFALYAVLFHTIELRQAPFFGWIRDLSQPDVLFHLPVAIPFIGTGISLLPIIMGITSFFQSKATMVDPNQKAMVYMMPIMMTFIFFTMPSGLVLYWLISNLFTIGQKALMKPSPAAQAQVAGG